MVTTQEDVVLDLNYGERITGIIDYKKTSGFETVEGVCGDGTNEFDDGTWAENSEYTNDGTKSAFQCIGACNGNGSCTGFMHDDSGTCWLMTAGSLTGTQRTNKTTLVAENKKCTSAV